MDAPIEVPYWRRSREGWFWQKDPPPPAPPAPVTNTTASLPPVAPAPTPAPKPTPALTPKPAVAAKPPGPEVPFPVLKLQGIIYLPSNPSTIINGR